MQGRITHPAALHAGGGTSSALWSSILLPGFQCCLPLQALSQPCSLSLVYYSPRLSQRRQTMLAVPVHRSVPWFLAGFYTQIKIDCCFISEIPMAAALHLPTGKINHSLTLPTHAQMLHTTGTKPGRRQAAFEHQHVQPWGPGS